MYTGQNRTKSKGQNKRHTGRSYWYQYQRAVALPRTVKDNISAEQTKQLQAHHTAQSITTLASSFISSAQHCIHVLSDNMVKLQSSTASCPSSFQTTSTPSNLRFNRRMPRTSPTQEKVNYVRKEVRNSVTPLLEAVRKGVSNLLARGKSQASEAAEPIGKGKCRTSPPVSHM
ncbi:uncharacterized protein LACBIDRAFT_317534 [Laccaria bicolor S238N-H82]|uniref:Predicted protein n=1 Tax=Laccaria bicolor (strain S238N-H82 / ATCC MYA-4686) TaxID=486041 RepID=B0E1X1_LACBS|nr:uncharacterized protein LACBIDRAFT_317534 [Laccaria bicolor S238N-H82]EDQ99172.1 predicted protein [Laccaria bicolor S238N-H82]|eukprot:XP_001890189.1 predicted protein [Laccaria bicolor S238N-H82]